MTRIPNRTAHIKPATREADFDSLERMAAQLCWMAGGDWNKKRTKKNLWRGRVLKLLEMVEARP